MRNNMVNFVLVHGGMVGGNCWKNVQKLLEDKGQVVISPTLTGLGERKHLSHPDTDMLSTNLSLFFKEI